MKFAAHGGTPCCEEVNGTGSTGPVSIASPASTSRHAGSCIPIRRSVSSRHDLRQEPYAVTPHVRVCAGVLGNRRPYRDLCFITRACAAIRRSSAHPEATTRDRIEPTRLRLRCMARRSARSFPGRANAGFTRTPRDGSRQRGQSPRPATSLIGLSSAQRGPEELHKPIHREALGVIFAQDQRTGDAQPVRFLL
jgi:hypothetical protein